MARLRVSADSLPMARGAAISSTALAIANRTARKSSVGTRSRRSLMRKKVDPQHAVIASSADVARRVVRRDSVMRARPCAAA